MESADLALAALLEDLADLVDAIRERALGDNPEILETLAQLLLSARALLAALEAELTRYAGDGRVAPPWRGRMRPW